jgi:hypothetical protein
MNLSDAQIAVANYTQRANLVMGPRGRASANYTTGVSVEELTT